MTKGPNRIVLDQYLDSAADGWIKGAGSNWKQRAKDLKTLGDALTKAAQQAELRIGEQTLTGPALRAGMEESATSLVTKSEQLQAAGEALTQVGQQLSDTKDKRDALADLGTKPAAYQAPAGTPGVETTKEELQAQADASQARSDERSAWQTQYDKQEKEARALTKEMDAAFLGAIPPMQEIHGEKDPTEPPPNVPSGPQGPYLPGTQAPPATGGGGGGTGGGGGGGSTGHLVHTGGTGGEVIKNPTVTTTNPTVITSTPTVPTPVHTVPTTTTHVPTETPTTTVSGTPQNGVTYQPTGSSVSAAPTTSGGMSGGSAAALGAASAGGMAAGSIRPGSVSAPTGAGSSPARAIGSTGRSGSAGALSRSSSASSSAAARAGSAGSTAGRGSAGSAAGRGASSGSTAGRGSAGGRGSSTGSGSRSGGRGSSGGRSAGSSGAGGRGGRKGDNDKTTDRDSLVYDQDWLGDDDVAPSVLD